MATSTTIVRAGDPHRAPAVSLSDQLGKGERRQSDRVKERMHGHGNEDGAAPFVGNRETASEDKERRERRQMRVDCREKQRARQDADASPEISPGHSVDEKAEDEFLGYGREGNSEHDDEDSLLQRARFTKHLDDGLLLRRAPQDA